MPEFGTTWSYVELACHLHSCLILYAETSFSGDIMVSAMGDPAGAGQGDFLILDEHFQASIIFRQ